MKNKESDGSKLPDQLKIDELRQNWSTYSSQEKAERLRELVTPRRSIRSLAKALGFTDGTVRHHLNSLDKEKNKKKAAGQVHGQSCLEIPVTEGGAPTEQAVQAAIKPAAQVAADSKPTIADALNKLLGPNWADRLGVRMTSPNTSAPPKPATPAEPDPLNAIVVSLADFIHQEWSESSFACLGVLPLLERRVAETESFGDRPKPAPRGVHPTAFLNSIPSSPHSEPYENLVHRANICLFTFVRDPGQREEVMRRLRRHLRAEAEAA